jgi:hypothetical protein
MAHQAHAGLPHEAVAWAQTPLSKRMTAERNARLACDARLARDVNTLTQTISV